jgi:hypothetical protein
VELFTRAAQKAWAAAVIAGLGPILVLLTSTDEPITWRNALASVIAGVVTGLGVFATPNKGHVVDDVPGRHAVDRQP